MKEEEWGRAAHQLSPRRYVYFLSSQTNIERRLCAPSRIRTYDMAWLQLLSLAICDVKLTSARGMQRYRDVKTSTFKISRMCHNDVTKT